MPTLSYLKRLEAWYDVFESERRPIFQDQGNGGLARGRAAEAYWLYAAQASPRIDEEFGENGRFWTETKLGTDLRWIFI